jgi:hypothetical protein
MTEGSQYLAEFKTMRNAGFLDVLQVYIYPDF